MEGDDEAFDVICRTFMMNSGKISFKRAPWTLVSVPMKSRTTALISAKFQSFARLLMGHEFPFSSNKIY
jgi:hypothetical protein